MTTESQWLYFDYYMYNVCSYISIIMKNFLQKISLPVLPELHPWFCSSVQMTVCMQQAISQYIVGNNFEAEVLASLPMVASSAKWMPSATHSWRDTEQRFLSRWINIAAAISLITSRCGRILYSVFMFKLYTHWLSHVKWNFWGIWKRAFKISGSIYIST